MNPHPMLRVLTVAGILLLSTLATAAESRTVYLVLWRGCEEACEGFREALAASDSDLEVVMRNADRDKGKLPGFVAEARELDANVVVTWGTSVTLGMAGTLADLDDPRFVHERPLVFMIVADPIGSGIVASYEATGRENVTGTRNRVPEEVNIQTIRAYHPGFATLGLLYNPQEPNSVLKRDELRELSETMGFAFVDRPLAIGSDGKPDAASIKPKLAEIKAAGADFLYFGSSSFLRVNGEAFTQAALDQGLPLLSPYEKLVRDARALLSVAAPYHEVGRLAAGQVLKILDGGATPGDLPVASLDRYAYLINMASAKQLGLFPPIDFLQFAETVN